MICEMNAIGFCKRHATIHSGRMKELALDPSDKGEKYRLLWDRMMSPLYIPPLKPVGCNKCGKK